MIFNKGIPEQSVTFFVFFLTSLWGFIFWSKQGKLKKESVSCVSETLLEIKRALVLIELAIAIVILGILVGAVVVGGGLTYKSESPT